MAAASSTARREQAGDRTRLTVRLGSELATGPGLGAGRKQRAVCHGGLEIVRQFSAMLRTPRFARGAPVKPDQAHAFSTMYMWGNMSR